MIAIIDCDWVGQEPRDRYVYVGFLVQVGVYRSISFISYCRKNRLSITWELSAHRDCQRESG